MRISLKNKFGIFPMPVLLISTYNEDGTVDTMNAAWGTLEDLDMVLLELTKDHKTSENIKKNGYFSVAPATLPFVKEADYFGIVSANKVNNKFEKSGLHFHQAGNLAVPVIDELPLSLICQLERIDETNGDFAVYGKIVDVQVDEKYLDQKGQLNVDQCEFITYFPSDHSYRTLSKKEASAFSIGKEVK